MIAAQLTSSEPPPVAPKGADAHRFKQTLKDARAGQTEAQYQLGLMLANGSGTRKDVNEALGWIQRAAERGHAAAQYMLGTHHCPEPGTAPATQTDETAAFGWLYKAAAQGHPRAHWRLARLIRQAHNRLAEAHEAAAADLGLPEAQLARARASAPLSATAASVNSFGQDAATNLSALRAAAEQGLPQAQTEWGQWLLRQAIETGDSQASLGGLQWLQAAAGRRWPPAVLALAEHGVRDVRLPANLPDPVDPGARHALGQLWERGLAGLPAHREEAARWYQWAAAQGLAAAHLSLGQLAETDPSGPGLEAAIEHYTQAAEAGSTEASWRLAECLRSSSHTPQHQLLAAYHQQRALIGGHPPALLALALCQDNRFGPLNSDLRDHALAQAAAAGLAEAQRQWALRLQQLAVRERDAVGHQQRLASAVAWLQRAARQGDTAALAALGMAHREGRGVPANPPLGLQLLEEAAHAGAPMAQWQLGLLAASGGGGIPRDLPTGLRWCRLAAEQGFVPAQASLGLLCTTSGEPEEAVHWWRLAATAGDPEAQVNLAHALTHGQGTAKDPAMGFQWLLRAAEQGLPAAQARLGLAYATGQGVAADLLAAHQWFYIARNGGEASAGQNLARSRGLLDAASQAEAERRAQAWLDRVACAEVKNGA